MKRWNEGIKERRVTDALKFSFKSPSFGIKLLSTTTYYKYSIYSTEEEIQWYLKWQNKMVMLKSVVILYGSCFGNLTGWYDQAPCPGNSLQPHLNPWHIWRNLATSLSHSASIINTVAFFWNVQRIFTGQNIYVCVAQWVLTSGTRVQLSNGAT